MVDVEVKLEDCVLVEARSVVKDGDCVDDVRFNWTLVIGVDDELGAELAVVVINCVLELATVVVFRASEERIELELALEEEREVRVGAE